MYVCGGSFGLFGSAVSKRASSFEVGVSGPAFCSLAELWCYVSGEVKLKTLDLSTELIR